MDTYVKLQDVLDICMKYCPDDDGSCSKEGYDIREMLDELEALPTIEADIDRVAILKLCNQIEMIIVTVCNTGYTLQPGDEEAILNRTKAIKEELTEYAGTD